MIGLLVFIARKPSTQTDVAGKNLPVQLKQDEASETVRVRTDAEYKVSRLRLVSMEM